MHARGRTLDLEETTEALRELKMQADEDDVAMLFAELDTDSSGDLDFDEFSVLAQKASTTNFVVDYIPLREIVEIDYEIAPQGGDSKSFRRRPSGGAIEDEGEPKEGFLKTLMTKLETLLGIDLDGDGGVSNEPIPYYNRSENEFHLIITTDPAGRFVDPGDHSDQPA